jgi:ech hydrogenase subunit C
VVAVGTCSCSGGIFRDGYNVLGGIDQVLPVDMYVPGCPCRPEAVVGGLVQLLEQVE